MKNVQLLARKCRERRELPAVMVKKSGKSCRKHGGRKKNCKMRANWQKMAVPAMPEKITKKTGILARAHGQVMSCASVPPAIVWHPLWQRQFLPPLFFGGAGCKTAFATYILTEKAQKSLDTSRGDWRATLLRSQPRVRGMRGRERQDLAADHGSNGAGAAPTPK